MIKTAIFTVVLSLGFIAGTGWAADMPAKYKKCKACHGIPGVMKKKMGPNLAASSMTLEQFNMMVTKGSKWDGRPAKIAGFEKKKMKPQKGLSEEQVKEIFDYVQAAK